MVGTSHIAADSAQEIVKLVEEEQPGLIAVELDKRRLHALLSKEKPKITFTLLRTVGVKGFLFALLGSWVQRKLGRLVGVEPGVDMLTAVDLARQRHIKLALIDQDIEITLQNFSKALSWKERFRFLGDIVRAIFFRKREMRRLGLERFDLTAVPSKKLVQRLTKELHDRYPNIYRVLVAERNHVMARRLHALMAQFPDERILGVVGAGHEDDLLLRLRVIERQTASGNAIPSVG